MKGILKVREVEVPVVPSHLLLRVQFHWRCAREWEEQLQVNRWAVYPPEDLDFPQLIPLTRV